MPSHFETLDHPLQHKSLNILIVDSDGEYAEYIGYDLLAYVGGVEYLTDYEKAYERVLQNPLAFQLVILGLPYLNEDALNLISAFSNSNVLSLLTLVANVDARGIRAVVRRINNIGFCADKTYECQIIRANVDEIIGLINDKVNRSLNPFGIYQ
jgi:hypothetical protein